MIQVGGKKGKSKPGRVNEIYEPTFIFEKIFDWKKNLNLNRRKFSKNFFFQNFFQLSPI